MAKQKLNGYARTLKAVPSTKKGATAVAIAEKANVTYGSASVYLSDLVRGGQVAIAGSQPNPAGRGRPLTLYRK